MNSIKIQFLNELHRYAGRVFHEEKLEFDQGLKTEGSKTKSEK